MRIPNVVHVVFTHPQGFADEIFSLKEIRTQNPQAQILRYGTAAMRAVLRAGLTPPQFEAIEGANITQQTDIFRLLVLHSMGGIYTDIDRAWDRPVHTWVPRGCEWFLPVYAGDGTPDMPTWDFSYDLLASVPKNPIFQEVLERSFSKRFAGETGNMELGPFCYLESIWKRYMGEDLHAEEIGGRFKDGEAFYAFIQSDLLPRIPFHTATFFEDVRPTTPRDRQSCAPSRHDPDRWNRVKQSVYARYNQVHWQVKP